MLSLCEPYRERRVERQSHWPEALFRRLATLHLFNSDPLGMRNLRHLPLGGVLRFLQIQIKFIHTYRHLSVFCLPINSCPPQTICHLCVKTYQKTFVYESSNSDHLPETILDIRDAKWFIYIRMPLYTSISIVSHVNCSKMQ